MSGNTIMDTISIAMVFAILGFGVFLSFKILNFTDLTVEASFGFGAVICGMICNNKITDFGSLNNIKPILALICAFLGGAFAGLITALLNTKAKINSVLSGILTLTAFYTINIIATKKDGFTNSSIGLSTKGTTIFTQIGSKPYIVMIVLIIITAIVGVLLALFFKTKLGLSIRACGDNEQMTKTQGISTDLMKIIGLSLSNAIVAFAGALYVMQRGSYAARIENGMMVVGVATIIIGEVLVRRSHNLNIMLLGIVGGSIIYRFIFALALRADFIDTNYLQLISALLVIIVLVGSKLINDYKHKKKSLVAASELDSGEESDNA